MPRCAAKLMADVADGSKLGLGVMSAARPLFPRKRKSISDLAMSQTCHKRTCAFQQASDFHHRCHGHGRSTRTESTTNRFPCVTLVDRVLHGTSKFCEARPPRGTFSNSQSSRRAVAIPPLLTGIARNASAKERRALRPWRNFSVRTVHSPSVRRYLLASGGSGDLTSTVSVASLIHIQRCRFQQRNLRPGLGSCARLDHPR